MSGRETPTSRAEAVRLVRIAADDVEQLAALWEAMRTHYLAIAPGLPIYSAKESWARRAGQYRDLLEHEGGVILALRLDGGLVAYAAIRPAESSSVFSWSEHTAELETLVVATEVRDRGLGRLLLDHVRWEVRERGFDELSLRVLVTNESALGFYEQAGFRPYLMMLSDAIPPAD